MSAMWSEGEDELAALFDSLAEDVSGDVLRSAANAGAGVIKAEVIMRAPRVRGVLADNIYQKHIPELSTVTSQTYHVSWRKKSRAGESPYYGAWVEYGHWYVPPKPDGITWKRHRVATKAIYVPAHPFLRPAYEAKKGAALAAMQSKLKENVAAILEKHR
ncbi:MAG: hypothetical protein GAK35_02379 [Herbaspirillum frisingense]|uniref:HK97 gp10 family phage protein n=1 Tax=Herbaspirillum frisingense TaxID=92645 RepID=A0A7V8FWA2_9BURK|nr:MAG: hypothetical protein GAK35_02379 [Herbaspirillum frisingense]